MSTSKDNNTPDSTEESEQQLSTTADEKVAGATKKTAGDKVNKVKAEKIEGTTGKTADDKAEGAATTRKKSSNKTKNADSAKDEKASDDAKPSKRRRGERPQPVPGMNPAWWAPVMCTLMIVGLLWIVAFYLLSNGTESARPIPGIGYGNLAIGFALIMAGFIMTTRWK